MLRSGRISPWPGEPSAPSRGDLPPTSTRAINHGWATQPPAPQQGLSSPHRPARTPRSPARAGGVCSHPGTHTPHPSRGGGRELRLASGTRKSPWGSRLRLTRKVLFTTTSSCSSVPSLYGFARLRQKKPLPLPPALRAQVLFQRVPRSGAGSEPRSPAPRPRSGRRSPGPGAARRPR